MASTFGGNPTRCPRCDKTVYMAEEIIAAGRKYHKSCLKCSSCSVSLQPGQIADKDGRIYCKKCYGRDFGPKGYGYGGGAGVLSSEAQVDRRQPAAAAPRSNAGKHFCAQCGAAGQQGAFCTQCGNDPKPKQQAPPPRPATKPQLPADVCPSCGAPGQLKAFCSQCGYNKAKGHASGGGGGGSGGKPVWVSDDASQSCMKCGVPFSFTNRRHHCRGCGLLVCAACSPNTMELPYEQGKVRVCSQCYH